MKHFAAIDGLRAWMAWWVVCQHVLQISGIDQLYPNPIIRFLTMGGLAVAVFVIISGFVITHLMIAKPEPFGKYIFRRFLRIYPLFAFSVLAALALRPFYIEFIALIPWGEPGRGAAMAAEAANLPAHLLAHAMLLHGILPNSILQDSYSAILAPAWSLSLEWQFYVLAPILLAPLIAQKRVITVLICAACSVALVTSYQLDAAAQWPYPAFLPLAIGFFTLGMATRLWLHGTDWFVTAALLLVSAINLGFYASAYTGGHIVVAMIPVVIWALTVFTCLKSEWLGRFQAPARIAQWLLASRSVVEMGKWSYSTYLLHIPVFVIVLAIAAALGMPLEPTYYFGALVLASLAMIPISFLSYKWIEQGAIKAVRNWIAGKQGAGIA